MLPVNVLHAQVATLNSPDGKLTLQLYHEEGQPGYSVAYAGKTLLEKSPLGLVTNEGDFSKNLTFKGYVTSTVDKSYTQDKIKQSAVHYQANKMVFSFEDGKQRGLNIVFQVSNNDVAFRYELPQWGERRACVVEKETTGFKFPEFTTTFLSPMMGAMGAFARTSPSYESGYTNDEPVGKPTHGNLGYVFPGLFRIGNDGWALISETGVTSQYCASHLSDGTREGLYTVEYPDMRQNNGFGSSGAQISLPGVTPWRTITMGSNLKPIVETTIPFDVVEPLYPPTKEYQYGRGTWSWIVWQDQSMNWDDQVAYIDLAAELGYEYILIDALWDTQIGYEKMEELIRYAQAKDVDVFLWYNSNGGFNDAPQGPRNKMNTSIARKQEMKWLQKMGVKGLKVDFFGGDKQETMRFYEDILSDANDHGLMIIFHGCTLPRGWERMYPNFVGSEAVLASEMLIFSQDVREKEAFYATLHPFIRNTVGSMEYGGVLFNKYLNRGNSQGQKRLTSDVFQIATGILFQNPVQMFALTPNNLVDTPAFLIDFMKKIPTTWDETVYVDGYPGKYAVIARRHGNEWYISGVNALEQPLDLELNLPMVAGKEVTIYSDNSHREALVTNSKINQNGKVTVTLQPKGGLVIKQTVPNLSAGDLKLRYDQPARIWEEAIPLGNSRLGAMVYGIPGREELQLNEETIWGGGPYRNDNPEALNALPEVRNLIFERKHGEADELINQTFFTKTHGMPFQTAGSVILDFPGHGRFDNYSRELELDRAVTTTRYQVDGVEYTREAFASFPDDVIIMRISANKKGALNFHVGYTNPSEHTVFHKENVLVLEGKGSDHEGVPGVIRYQIHTLVKSKDGNTEMADDKITVTGATSVDLYISLATNFTDYKTVDTDPAAKAAHLLSVASQKEFASAMKEHSRFYNQQFGRFTLDLGGIPGTDTLTTPERILNFQHDQDPALVTLLSQFGRYLLISSSQPGGQPANLQGIWCNSMTPAWDSKYTININTEMNYWPAEVTNLSETHDPLFQMLKELNESGHETAKVMYGADGWVAHHNTDLWRVTSPIDFAAAGMWPTGGAWLSQHIWERYLFTGDKQFLAEAYPVLKGSADFFMTSLIQHPANGWMVVSPSVSPEHGPITAGCTMDNQLVWDLLSRTAEATRVLNGDEGYRASLLAMAAKIPPMQIGQYSQLQEWLEDWDDPKNEHRHVSHLYGLYPGNQISPYRAPELFEASRNSLDYRGDLATGWSIGWKVNLWARLLDGDRAYKIINNMLTLASRDNPEGRTYPNMFTAHPPFQIDGNFGLTAGVAEMLLQSHDGALHLLPALPTRWKNGSVSGIMARGGFEVSMKWEKGNVTELKVLAKIGGNLRLRSYTPLTGEKLVPARGENPNPLLQPATIAKPIVSDKASLKGVQLNEVFEYDVPTQAGNIYIFKAKN